MYGKSPTEVETKLVALRERADQGVPATPGALTLAAYLQEWVTQVAAPRVRASTLSGYRYQIDRYLLPGRYQIDRYLLPGLGRKRLGRLTARDVRLYLDRLRSDGAGARTIQYVHATLRAALEDVVREEILSKNVAKLVQVPTPPKSERDPLDVHEVRILLKSARDHRVYAMFVVFALLGMRRSEVLGLRWEDVELDQELLHVRRGLQRVDGELRRLPTKTAPRNCTPVVQRQCEKAHLRPVRLHDFRHGRVSVLLGLGVPPRTTMEIVGHDAGNDHDGVWPRDP